MTAHSDRFWQRLLPWLWAAAAGITLALALPGLCWAPLLLLFPGLLLEGVRRMHRARSAALLGWWAGAVSWLLSTSWVLPVMHDYGGLPLPAAVLCMVLMAIYLGFTWTAVTWLTWLVPERLRVLLFPLAWSAIEAWRQAPPYLFPWNPTAAALAPLPPALASLPIWGATGLTWTVIALGTGLWGLLRRESRRLGLISIVAALLLLGLCSLLAPPARPVGEPLTVAAIQPGTTLEQTWDPAAAAAGTEQVWRLSHQAAAGPAAPDLLLWPESAVPNLLERDPVFRHQVGALARELDAAIVLSSIGFLPDGGYTNAAFLIRSDGTVAPRYDKVRLVPFGEYVPVIARFAFAKSLVRQVAAFTPGRHPQPLAGPVPIGMSICYEIIFADLVAGQVQRGAQVLATLTNDGWYGYSWAPEQHLQQAVLRAVETRRWLVRAALTGISVVVAPDGRVVKRLEIGETGIAVTQVQPCTGLTPRVRWGDWWGWLCALTALAVLVIGRRSRRNTG